MKATRKKWTAMSAAVITGGALAVAGALPASAIVAGAGYTTFDAVQGGCLDNHTGVNCNNYTSKDDVYMSGGPTAAGLSDGDYYFSVLVPGFQNGGFAEGADGNLSDETAGSTTGDAGSGDAIGNRTFTVSDHLITTYLGTHTPGTSPNGKAILQLMRYDDTSNAGGVYILAICQLNATLPSQCKYDAFRITPGGTTIHNFGVISGEKYYDANLDGQLDNNEVGIAGWPINYADGISGTEVTDSDGQFSDTFVADTYTFGEQVANSPWVQTGNTVAQTNATGTASATLNADKTYSVTTVDDSEVSGINFGNVCIGAGGGLTLGFWSNRNGQALIGSTDLAMLDSLNLVSATGSAFNPTTAGQVKTWLLNATATNMAYMLSVQLAAMELNVFNGFVVSSTLVYAPNVTGANGAGFISIADLMAAANTDLGTAGHNVTISGGTGAAFRAYQETLKTALDQGNNNLNFLQPGPGTCPTPVFPS
jgi:hypothetical protein